MVKKKNEPVSRTITAEDMRDSMNFRYIGIISLIMGSLGMYFMNPWMTGVRACSEQSGMMCSIGVVITMLVIMLSIAAGLILVGCGYHSILHDTEEYKDYHKDEY